MPESNTPIGRASIGRSLRPGAAGISSYAMRTNCPYPEGVTRIGILGVACALVLAVADATGAPHARQDVAIPMDDAVQIAGTLFVPNGQPPAGGWPAVVL